MPRKSEEAKKNLVTFSDDFYSDLEDMGMLSAVLIRSPHEKGKIVAINCELPKDYYFIRNSDLPAKKSIQTLGKKTPLFCEKEIIFKGQPLGILCGPDLRRLKELRDKFEILIEDEERSEFITPVEEIARENKAAAKMNMLVPPVVAIALANNDNILAKRVVETGFFSDCDEKTIDDRISGEKFYVKSEYSSTIGSKIYGECNGAFVAYKSGKIKVFTPSLWIGHLKENLLETTGLGEEKIMICHTKTCASNTSALYTNTEIACQAAVASVLLKKSVKLVLSREEQNDFIETISPVSISHKAAVSEDGEITALDVKITIDCGAYNPLVEEIVDRLTITSCGVYDIQNIRIVTVAKSTPNIPFTFDIRKIDPLTFFAIENFMQKIAFVTGIPAVDLRLSNIRLTPVQKTTMPFLFQPGKIYECLTAVSMASDFSRKHTVYRVSELSRKEEGKPTYSPFNPPLRGIGMACAIEGSVYFGSHFEKGNVTVSVTYNKDESLTISSLPVSDSIKGIWIKIVEEILEIPREKIKLTESFDDFSAFDLPELISRNIGIMTSLFSKCLETVKKQKSKKSAPFTVKKTMSPNAKKLWKKNEFCGSPFYSSSFGCAVLELEFNPESFREEIKQISICVDGGKIISKKAAVQTLKLEVQNCLKGLVKDENLACPVINIQLIESEKEAKQIGNLVSLMLPAAYTSALSQCLSLSVKTLPLRNDSLYKLLYDVIQNPVGREDEFLDVLANFIEEEDEKEK